MTDRPKLAAYIRQQRELGVAEVVLDHTLAELVPTPRQHAPMLAAPTAQVAPLDDARSRTQSPLASEHVSNVVEDVAHPATASADTLSSETMAAKKGLVVGSTDRELFGGPVAALKSIKAVADAVASCTQCPLYATATNPVPGEGSVHAQLMCVGEAPGATEDETGRPFVGAAGQLLTKILQAIDLQREDVFICNVLKHRPPGNRNPRPEEVQACSPYLIRQIELIRPKVIVAFGTFAAQTLLETKLSIGKLRGFIHQYHGTPLVVTYHPAALLRNPAWKRPTWNDVKLARQVLDHSA